jgi:GTP-binding protein EngB required for normal cell division
VSILSKFVEEYKQEFVKKETNDEKSLLNDIKKVKDALLDKKFLPSLQLKQILDKQIRKSRYPIEVAITGQFSAGKSTFLNALLSKKILPTGITPVTSKVNFINYGEDYKLKITYRSGAQELAPIEELGSFAHQRQEEMEDIKYFTLYAPMDILKDITFIDTPGLNSQSQSDTYTTRKVLRDVGGIIWLTLIDNAGKMSEVEVLEEYMVHFKHKSLCVLNQKDKLTPEQVESTIEYVKEKFSKYFADVIPISSKQALESRRYQKNILIEDQLDSITKEFKSAIAKNTTADSMEFFKHRFDNFHQEIKKIQSKDMTDDLNLLEESNINKVLEFIENTIRPQAAEMKEFSIKKDLKNICDILEKEYVTIIGAYDALIDILKDSENDILKEFDAIHTTYTKEFYNIYYAIEAIIQRISTEIYQNIKKDKATRYEKQTGFFKKACFKKVEYDTYKIDVDMVFENLFYDDQLIEKMFKRAMKELKQVELMSDEAYRDVYRNIKHRVHRWQERYELIKKHREIASDAEFSETRHFAAKVYENILRNYHRAILENISALRKKYAYFNGAISYSHIHITQTTISYFEQKINESMQLYENDPTKFDILHPKEDEILSKLKSNFDFDKIEELLISKRNYLYKIIQYSKEQYLQINKDSIELVESKKQNYILKIEDLQKIKNNI